MAQSLCASMSSTINRLNELVNTYTALKTISGMEQVLAIIIRKQCVFSSSEAINMFTKLLGPKSIDYTVYKQLLSIEGGKKTTQSIELVFEVTYSKQENILELFYI